ncbi:MAG: molybdopterin molybdotransferase MoeA [Candidatus Cloacimonetes bacterium]|nr:molybdopterin molybdotransferase MoeA [Candidatus Cloacimonadota bacterium]
MHKYEDCLNIISECLTSVSLDTETVGLEYAANRVLATDIHATEDHPRFDHSAMDGYLIHRSLLTQFRDGKNPILTISESLVAGEEIPEIKEELQAIEIMTGAKIPSDAFWAVIRLENTTTIEQNADAKRICLNSIPNDGENIRRQGEDIKLGQLLLPRGTKIEFHHLMVLANMGIDQVEVLRKVQLAIVSTGKELVSYATKNLNETQIRNATGIYLEAYLRGQGHDVKNLGIVRDDPTLYRNLLLNAFDSGQDLLISTGAVSMGKYDFVKETLLGLGAQIHFHKCSIHPGKPILFASLNYRGRERFIFGIPGNLAASAVGLRFFLIPFLNQLTYCKSPEPVYAELLHDVKVSLGFRSFFCAELSQSDGVWKVSAPKRRSAASLSQFLKTNAWAVFSGNEEFVPKGQKVEVFRL